MNSQLLPLIVFQVAAFAGAAGQMLYKVGANGGGRGRVLLAAGTALYIGVTVLFLVAYRMGGEVSVLYPTYGATFVWGAVLARRCFGEPLTAIKLTGTSLVIGGICLVTL